VLAVVVDEVDGTCVGSVDEFSVIGVVSVVLVFEVDLRSILAWYDAHLLSTSPIHFNIHHYSYSCYYVCWCRLISMTYVASSPRAI
jgi:hypothetical protein